MSKNTEHKVGADGRSYVVRKKADSFNDVTTLLGALAGYLAFLGMVYGTVAFNRPELIDLASQNKAPLFTLLFSVGAFFVAFIVKMSSLGSGTFEKVNTSTARVKFESSLSLLGKLALFLSTGLELADGDDSDSKKNNGEGKNSLKSDYLSYGAVSNGEPFEIYCSSILKSLSAYATSSEVTATKLLDKGVAFMAGGLVFYLLAIVIWQVFANLTHPDPYVMYVGMAACSMTFIVVEFLAAWFFKQYRYYVEVSLACLRVRSVYDRYLLGYYALKEFKTDGDEKIRNQMSEILKEDVKWPTYKGASANDFNYMVESMSSAHMTLGKLKDLFQPEKPKPDASAT